MLRFALLAVLLASVGCSSGGASSSSTGGGGAGAGAAAGAGALPAVEAGKARLVFYRSGSMIASLDKPNILMDGVVIGKSESGYYSYADVEPGKHLIECKSGDRISVPVAAGQTAYLETSVKAGINDFQFNVEQKPEAEAQKKIAKLKFRPPAAPVSATPPAPAAKTPAAAGASTTRP
jgi:hypothetical protein